MLRVLICVIPPVALFMFIQKPHGCLLGTTSAYISSFHSVGHFICFTYISLTNSLRHLETRRHLAFLSPVRTFLSLLWLYAWLMVSRRLLGSQCTAVGSVCWQDINRNGYPYFLCAVGTHTLSFNQFITRSAWAAILSFSRQPMYYPFSASHSLHNHPLYFQCPLSPIIPSFSYLSIRVSCFQLKSIGTDIPSVPPSYLLFFHSVLQLSFEFYHSFPSLKLSYSTSEETEIKSSYSGQSMWCAVLSLES